MWNLKKYKVNDGIKSHKWIYRTHKSFQLELKLIIIKLLMYIYENQSYFLNNSLFCSFFLIYWNGVRSQLQAAPPCPWRHWMLHHAAQPVDIVNESDWDRKSITSTDDCVLELSQAGQPNNIFK